MFRRNVRRPDQSDYLAGWVTKLGTAKRIMVRSPHPGWPEMIERLERRVFLLQKVVNAGSEMGVLSPAEYIEVYHDDDLLRDYYYQHEAAQEAAIKAIYAPLQQDE